MYLQNKSFYCNCNLAKLRFKKLNRRIINRPQKKFTYRWLLNLPTVNRK